MASVLRNEIATGIPKRPADLSWEQLSPGPSHSGKQKLVKADDWEEYKPHIEQARLRKAKGENC